MGRGDTRFRDYREPVPITGTGSMKKCKTTFEQFICAIASLVSKKPPSTKVKIVKEKAIAKKKVDQGETKIWECSICGKKYKSSKPPAKCGMCFYNFFKEGKELRIDDGETTYKPS